MQTGRSTPTSRRRFLRVALAPAAVALTPWPAALAQTRSRPAMPTCGVVTPRQTEGPFFSPGSPRRTSLLEPGVDGTRLVVTGRVLDPACAPVAGALLDFWQADADGEYDNRGFRLRGHQFADEEGRYRLETIVPAVYPGRTRHIHVKVQAPGGPVLTSQLYFPDEPLNRRDGIFNPMLVMAVEGAGAGRAGRFDFVVPVADRR